MSKKKINKIKKIERKERLAEEEMWASEFEIDEIDPWTGEPFIFKVTEDMLYNIDSAPIDPSNFIVNLTIEESMQFLY